MKSTAFATSSPAAGEQHGEVRDGSNSIRVLVADDHPVIRFGVRTMLESEPGMEVIGEADDGDAAIQKAVETEPDVLLLDLAMPRMPGLEAMREIVDRTPRVKVLLLTSAISTQQIIEGLQIGARGIVLKDSAAADLTGAIRAVMSGDYWIGGKRVTNLLQALQGLMASATPVPERRTYGLTPRELQVVQCIVEGCSNRDIAKQFQISEETVKRHLSNTFDKTGVSTRLELALFAISHKLVIAFES